MTTSTLPRIAAELDLTSGVYYAAESTVHIVGDDEHLIVWMPGPTMAAETAKAYRWVEDGGRVGTPHATLDEIAVTKLLYIADGEPLELTDTDALDAINTVLAEVHCNMMRCSARIAAEVFDGQRWRCCEQLAARLVGTGA